MGNFDLDIFGEFGSEKNHENFKQKSDETCSSYFSSLDLEAFKEVKYGFGVSIFIFIKK